jgi:PPK2 family polyphosphate:nucleotide phosphotransferase
MFGAAPHARLVPFDGSFRIADAATSPSSNSSKSKDWEEKLESEVRLLGRWQHKLFAHGRYAMLVVFQALDAAGKDGMIRHVFGRVNPCGLQVASFKRPSTLELAHDFLWRSTPHLPARGHLAIFNRSYYEEVLVVRVHPELLEAQNLPSLPGPDFWAERYRAIVEHERHLAQQGTVILKFWLNVSKSEQRNRFLERAEKPSKHWKFSAADLDERALWGAYQSAYEQCLAATSRPWAPWYAIPADDKHYSRWQVARLVNAAFEQLGVDFPEPTPAEREALEQSRARLLAERD